MSDHLTAPVLILGVGAMADAYAAALRDMGRPFIAAGRGRERAEAFAAKWQVQAGHGELVDQWQALVQKPVTAIVAVNANTLARTSAFLIDHGVKRLLIEKPAGLELAEVQELQAIAKKKDVDAYVGYNRRFYGSVEIARRMIAEDGGALSVKFDFTEASKRLEALDKPADELAGWFYANSTHVIDLAFFLGGEPTELNALSIGKLPWHPEGAIFTGMGRLQSGASFCYHANWISAGRWGVEVMTAKRRLVLQPMEQLSYQDHFSFTLKGVELPDDKDIVFKPGIYRQTEAFVGAKPDSRLLGLNDHARLFGIYACIRTGDSYRRDV
ncbi:Gfo/Idh/MocA family protein [Thalassospira xianhensis]|uniref:Gfo/Idh/MocA-like oxidoreductase N-terminal domain-containing protein n=1 Tax=Thalassospira xianhensis MCCC 1A02616 TaxID=1177929 RepID=A0A367UGD8_9PROT|nr:Gfo/Idh/MocA family oxidoreductase [Thalassospira xianhensis]RCK07376.1 hypothetical protein TH5_03020 [Thalassospira xianhensis MCCC 1A02616]